MPTLSNGTIRKVKSWPIIGNGFSIYKDSERFFKNCKQEYGNIFSISILNQEMTVITESSNFDAFLRKSKSVTTDNFTSNLASKLLRIPNDIFHKTFRPQVEIFRSCLAKNKLEDYNKRLVDEVITTIEHVKGGHHELYQFIGEIVFIAGGASLFSKGIFDKKKYKGFRDYDNASPIIMSGLVPHWLLYRANKGFVSLTNALNDVNKDGFSDLCKKIESQNNDVGLNQKEKGIAQFSLFWAANANTVNIAFWAVVRMLDDKEATKNIKKEISEVNITDIYDQNTLNKLELINSLIYEALRCYTGVAMIRDVIEDITIALPDNQAISFNKGDRFCLYPRLSYINKDNFEKPEQFIYDRFFKKPELYQRMYSWGGGNNICPGRFFAANEIKIMIFILLKKYDFKLLDKIPPYDTKRLMMPTTCPTKKCRSYITRT